MTRLPRLLVLALLGWLTGCVSAPRIRPPPPPEQVPVLFVPGIMQTALSYTPMMDAFVDAGWARDRLLAVDFHPRSGEIPLEAMAYQVLDAAQALRRHTGAERIDVVAFSQGSLPARYWMQELGGQPHVRRFVSLSGPHHGTWIAYLLGGPAVVEMRPGSAFLRELNRHEGQWGDTEVFSFRTPLDSTVLPSATAELKGATNRVLWLPLHQLMLDYPCVISRVRDLLAQPSRPSPARPPALQESH